jgi:hypothetical protein
MIFVAILLIGRAGSPMSVAMPQRETCRIVASWTLKNKEL